MSSRRIACIIAVAGVSCVGSEERAPAVDDLYNPCGPSVAPEDCAGGRPGAPADGRVPLDGITGSRGEHTLEVLSLSCTIRLDSVGTAIRSDLCPDCDLALQMSHMSLDDGCGVGAFSYTSVIGLLRETAGVYTLYVTLDGTSWYASGEGLVSDGILTYDARTVYDLSLIHI